MLVPTSSRTVTPRQAYRASFCGLEWQPSDALVDVPRVINLSRPRGSVNVEEPGASGCSLIGWHQRLGLHAIQLSFCGIRLGHDWPGTQSCRVSWFDGRSGPFAPTRFKAGGGEILN